MWIILASSHDLALANLDYGHYLFEIVGLVDKLGISIYSKFYKSLGIRCSTQAFN